MIKYRILRLDGQEAGGMKSWSKYGDFAPAELKAYQASFDTWDEAAAILREIRQEDPERAELMTIDSYIYEVPGRAEAVQTMQATSTPGLLRRVFSKYDEARAFCETAGGYMGYSYYGNTGMVFPVFKEV